MITVAGKALLSGRIVMPRIGAWTADVHVDSDEPIAGPVEIVTSGLTLRGFARSDRSGVSLNSVRALIVGGAGGLRRRATAQHYRGVPLRLPVVDLLGAGGEALAASSTTSVLATQLPSWTQVAQSVGQALDSLVAVVPGAAWRVLADGSVWIGQETWPTLQHGAIFIEEDANEARGEWAPDAPELYPGVTIDDGGGVLRRVGDVEHVITDAEIQTIVWYEDDERTGGLRGQIGRMVRAAFPRIDYLARYDGTVVAQSSDGRFVDVRLDDTARFGEGVAHVPLRLGLPGATAKVNAGARVLVGWDGGDPQRPYAEAFPGGEAVTTLEIVPGGAAAVRVGDRVDRNTAMTTWMTSVEGFINGIAPGTVVPLIPPATIGTAAAGSGKVTIG